MDPDREFTSPDEEIDYWKNLAKEYKQSVEEAREELDEFQIGSRELEAELEAQLEQQEKKNRELVSSNSRLQMEVEMLREKLETQQASYHKQTSELSEELAQLRGFKDELQKYIRELEQMNDDLERTKRATVVSLEDFESRLNFAIERNAFLESELEERETLSVTVQRLKDEARDLRQEMAVRDSKSPDELPTKPTENVSKPAPLEQEKGDGVTPEKHVDSNRISEGDFITPNSTPAKAFSVTSNGTPLTPSARISALNIVGDLLRKVGALESKLASCKNFVKDQPRSNKSGSSSPLNSPSRSDVRTGPRSNRAKRLHRAATGPSSSGGAPPASTGYVKIAV